MSQTTDCLIRQANCGRVAGEPICPKCGLDANARYVSEESGLLAASQAEAKYWQNEATQIRTKDERLKLDADAKKKADEAMKQAENERLIKAQLEHDEAQRLAAEQAQNELLARQREGEESKKKSRLADMVFAACAFPFVLFFYGNDVIEYLKTGLNKKERLVRELQMVEVPGGSFQMGSNDSEALSNEKPVHTVNVKSFAIGKYEVTQGQWRAIMGNNPSHFASCGDSCPVEQVSWNDIQSYIQKLNQKTGQQFRLPSEAEWEYACRGGQQQKYCGSDDVDKVAVYGSKGGIKTQPKGSKGLNGYGLYDMSGNVLEWVQDWYHDSYSGAPSDGSAWVTGGEQKFHVMRGGSWREFAWGTRSTMRGNLAAFSDINSPDVRHHSIGFRLARTVP
jgi:formylglycine-generating enzyme required for sulfatase activity